MNRRSPPCPLDPGLAAKVARPYLDRLEAVEYAAALCLLLELDRPVQPDWTNVAYSALPFCACPPPGCCWPDMMQVYPEDLGQRATPSGSAARAARAVLDDAAATCARHRDRRRRAHGRGRRRGRGGPPPRACSCPPGRALAEGDRPDWAWRRKPPPATWRSTGAPSTGIVRWSRTRTGAATAADKVPGVRAALCADAATADGARRWNDANALAISLGTMSAAVLGEVRWTPGSPAPRLLAACRRANVAHVDEISGRLRAAHDAADVPSTTPGSRSRHGDGPGIGATARASPPSAAGR